MSQKTAGNRRISRKYLFVPFVRNQEKRILAKGVSAELSVTPRRTKNTKDIEPSSTFGTQSATAKRGIDFAKTPSKTPFPRNICWYKKTKQKKQQQKDKTDGQDSRSGGLCCSMYTTHNCILKPIHIYTIYKGVTGS